MLVGFWLGSLLVRLFFVCLFFFFVLRSIFESALNWWLFLWKATEFGFVFLLFADLFSVVIVGFFLLRSDFVSTTPIDWVSLLAVDWLLFFALVACYFFLFFFWVYCVERGFIGGFIVPFCLSIVAKVGVDWTIFELFLLFGSFSLSNRLLIESSD